MNSILLNKIKEYLFVPLKCNDDVLYSSYKGYYGYNKKIVFNMVEFEYYEILDIKYCNIIFYIDLDSVFSTKVVLNSENINSFNFFDSFMKSNFTII